MKNAIVYRCVRMIAESCASVPFLLYDGAAELSAHPLLALLARADVLLSPDSGPAHMATAVGLPVIGLYAATNPARSGPYLSRATTVDRYAEAARRFLDKMPGELPWTTKIERPGVMDLIAPADVISKLDAVIRDAPRRR